MTRSFFPKQDNLPITPTHHNDTGLWADTAQEVRKELRPRKCPNPKSKLHGTCPKNGNPWCFRHEEIWNYVEDTVVLTKTLFCSHNPCQPVYLRVFLMLWLEASQCSERKRFLENPCDSRKTTHKKAAFSRQYQQIHLTGMLILMRAVFALGVGVSRLKWHNYVTVPTCKVLNHS